MKSFRAIVLIAAVSVAVVGHAQNAGGIDLSKIDPKLIQQGMQMLQIRLELSLFMQHMALVQLKKAMQLLMNQKNY